MAPDRERTSRDGDVDPVDPLEALLVACLERVELEGPQAVDAFCREHPEHDEELRREIATLERLGLFDREAERGADVPVERIGGFRLVRRLGEGGMGVVYLAEQIALKRLVALKVLRAGPWASAGLATRFRREAQTVAKLRHEGIVTLYAAGEEDGVSYLAMELVAGEGLDELLARTVREHESLPIPRVVRFGRDLALALACAHAAGVVHRDVKPSNVRITPEDRAMLLDFGLARDLGEPGLTRTGEFQGSPHYASPEQVSGAVPVGPASDLFSLGATLYECATQSVPFPGETTEQVFQSILACAPEPARRRNPAVPRDLETVISKALERDPARRYADAPAFADDLDAILELRPIAARRPGALARAVKWARRNPAAASGTATGTIGLVVLLLVVLAQARAGRERVREEARAAIADARGRLAAFRTSRARMSRDESRLSTLQEDLAYRYLASDEDRELDRLEIEVAHAKRARETIVVGILALLQRAEVASPDEARELRAELYAEKLAEAENERNPGLASFYRELVLADDPHGRVVPAAVAGGTVAFESEPPGAEVHLFRYREELELRADGERRLVPVPYEARPSSTDGRELVETALPLAPGTICLRVVRGAGALATGDHVLGLEGFPIGGTILVEHDADGARTIDRLVAIDGAPIRDAFDLEERESARSEDGALRRYELERSGRRIMLEGMSLAALGLEARTPAELAERGGVRARVDHAGTVADMLLPAGLVVRATAAPLFASRATRIGTAPTAPVELEPGGWLALFRLDGFDEQRRPFAVGRGSSQTLRVELAAHDVGPEGFVRVVAGYTPDEQPVVPFWLQEREVTFAEYLEFLDDPAVAREIESESERILVPRERLRAHCARADDGRWKLLEDNRPDWPVFGVSWHDARRYARWRTERARARGELFVFDLPTFAQWCVAGHAADGRIYVFGSRFRPKWVKSNYARPKGDAEPVLRFPIDECVFGAFDMSGSVLEWLEDPYVDGERRRTVGGAWGLAAPSSYFLVEGGGGMRAETVSNLVGFRLAACVEPR